MIKPIYFDSKKSLNLYGIIENFKFLKNLYIKNKLPNVLMLSGNKGSGKSTLINHLMYYIFDKNNYDEENNILKQNSIFYNLFLNNIFTNIINLSGSNFKNVKVEDIRDLKIKIYQTSISDKPRFIIFDDIELFNHNSLNALLKIIEEPTKNNFFILINNKSKPLIDTIKSRCFDYKVVLNEEKRLIIINHLIKKYKIKLTIDPKISQLSPGHFIKFNYILEANKISLDEDYLKNLGILLNIYKKSKDAILIDIILFLTDNFFNNLKKNKSLSDDKVIEYKSFITKNINNFFLYNLNQNGLLNAISTKITDE